MKRACVYILHCADSSYYTGCTTNLDARIAQHQDGLVEGYTKSRRPVNVVFTLEFPSIMDAAAAERRIKGWSRRKKQALINGDYALLRELSECRNVSHSRNRP